MTAPSPAPRAPAPLDQLAEFLGRVSRADELDDRLELPDAPPEVARVIDALNAFLDKLWAKDFQLSAKREMLEKVVEIRTAEVHEILDNVHTGFLLALADETVLDNFSRSCLEIFGVDTIKGRKLGDLLGVSERDRATFRLAYEQIFTSDLPPEVAVGQLPAQFALGARTYAIQGAPILGADGRVAKVFFTINDTTELRKLEAENALRQALLEIVRQKETFRAFLHETSTAFAAARAAASQPRYRALLHTLKGNLGCYGLHEMAALIHSIEDAAEITPGHLQHVEDTLKKFLVAHAAVIGLPYPQGAYGPRSVDLEQLRPALAALVAEDARETRAATVAELLRDLEGVPAGVLLAPLRGVVDRVAQRQDKLVAFELRGAEVSVDPSRVGAVFAHLGHLARNAVVHGIELPHERGDKPPTGRVTVTCRQDADAWTVEIADDGHGVDVDAVVRAALARGDVTPTQLAAMSRADRLLLAFRPGLTTSTDATIDAGRGVGTSAVVAAVAEAGGALHLTSTPGEGTQIAIRIPRRRDATRPPA